MITADSTPNHDTWGYDFTGYWSCNEWTLWHKALVERHGKEEADRIWIVEYDKSSWGAAEISCSTGSNDFKQYVLSNGLADKSSILSRVYRAELAVDAAVQPVKDFGSGVGTIIKWLPWIAVALVAGVVYVYAKPILKIA